MKNRSVPTAIILPHLAYRNLEEACEWLTRVFGFAEYYRHGQPVSGIQIYLGEAYIMLSTSRQGRSESPAKLGYGTQMLTIIVPDVEAHYAKTKRGGASIWEELHETIYGEKQYGATDLEGPKLTRLIPAAIQPSAARNARATSEIIVGCFPSMYAM